jgi:hypothetical protein
MAPLTRLTRDARQATPLPVAHPHEPRGFHVHYKGAGLGGVYLVDGYMVLINKDTTLPEAALMHGFSSKKDTLTTGGVFGDGCKLTCAALARHKIDAGFYSGGERLTFGFAIPEGRETPSLVLTRTALAEPMKDLVTYVHVGDDNVAEFLSQNFLLFGEGYTPMGSFKGGRVLRRTNKDGPQLTLHGIAFSSGPSALDGTFWSDKTLDLTISTTIAVRFYGITRDRVGDKQKVRRLCVGVGISVLTRHPHRSRVWEHSLSAMLCLRTKTFLMPAS